MARARKPAPVAASAGARAKQTAPAAASAGARARNAAPVAASLTVRELTPADWPVLVELFGSRGACGGCWCMWWRRPKRGKLWEEQKGSKNRDAFRRMVKAGEVRGVLAFDGDAPVGWCSYGPRESFPGIANARSLAREFGPGTWSVVCFYIPSGRRSQGVASLLLESATEAAFAAGAREVEGYPVAPKKPGEMPAAFAWTGVPPMFTRLGYRQLRRAAGARPIYVKKRR